LFKAGKRHNRKKHLGKRHNSFYSKPERGIKVRGRILFLFPNAASLLMVK
jgi:hypothetical protein